jgi:DNA repair protein SbcD/Mre11
MRVLCTGDLHIGRGPTRLPSTADARALSCATAWADIVDHAVGQRVDLVAVSGDLVDQANRYYESLGPLERGLRRLGEAGIAVVAVAGNHDYGVLPEIARALPEGCLRLLGLGGRWERTTVATASGALHVDGWSFPAAHVRENPLAAYDLPVATDAPVLGLLHADLDAPSSAYAPVALADLRARPMAMWLLGHVHAPRLHQKADGPAVLYPGSPQPMDPGETGAHGVWMADFAPGKPVVVRHVPLASVRYHVHDIDVSDAADVEELRVLVLTRLREQAEELGRDGGPLRHLSLRLRLTGRSPVHRVLEQECRQLATDLDLTVNGVGVHVERVDVATRPVRDLELLESGSDAAAVLARLLRDLDGGDGPSRCRDLLDAVQRIPATLQMAKPYRSLTVGGAEHDAAALRDLVAHQAGLLLDEILTRKEATA